MDFASANWKRHVFFYGIPHFQTCPRWSCWFVKWFSTGPISQFKFHKENGDRSRDRFDVQPIRGLLKDRELVAQIFTLNTGKDCASSLCVPRCMSVKACGWEWNESAPVFAHFRFISLKRLQKHPALPHFVMWGAGSYSQVANMEMVGAGYCWHVLKLAAPAAKSHWLENMTRTALNSDLCCHFFVCKNKLHLVCHVDILPKIYEL